MAVLSRCPPSEHLIDLVNGAAEAAEEENLLAHLESCHDCQHLLDELMGASPDLLKAARQVGRNRRLDEGCWQQLRADLEGRTGFISKEGQAQIPYPFWSRSMGPNALEALGCLEGYQVTRLLGEGGMGLVFEASERALSRAVAIKVLTPRLAGDAIARQRFAREARAAAAVRHPHVVTIHSVSEVAGLPYLVMEYCAGGSLQDVLDRQQPLPWQAVARLGWQVAQGLAEAHARGLVHRDIKPSNILLQTDGWPEVDSIAKIGDFGLAQVADESRLTETGQVAGTPMYMAPEQAIGGPLDGRADLFSLGSVLYALCTGQEPFPGGSPLIVLRQVCDHTPTPVRELNSAVPMWLAAIVTRLHARQPAERFDSAATVAELFRYNLAHPDSPRVVPPPRSATRTRRRWVAPLMAVLALVVLVGGLALAASLLSKTHTPPALKPRATLEGHGGPVSSVAFSPDGRTVVTGSDTSLRCWDADTGKMTRELAQQARIVVLAFTHGGEVLVSAGGDGSIRARDGTTWKELSGLNHPGGNLRRVAFGQNDLVAVPDNQSIEIWDVTTGKLQKRLPSENHATINALAFSPDGQTLASGDALGQICLWNVATGAETSHFQGDPKGLRAIAFSPDGQKLASAGFSDKTVSLWDVASGSRLIVLAHFDTAVVSMAFSPDGKRLAMGEREGGLRILAVDDGRTLVEQPAHTGAVWSLAFSPDGNTLVTAGEDHLAYLWDLGELAR